MIEFSFTLKSSIEQPTFDLINGKTNSRISCLYDTGATISVWTKSLNRFFEFLSPRPTNFYSRVTGYDDKEYNMLPVYAVDLKIDKYCLINIPVVVFPNTSNKSMLILAHTLFRFQDVRLIGRTISISIDTPNVFKFYPFKTDKFGCVYSVQSQSEQESICPVCGSSLLSSGLCSNPLCEYTDRIMDLYQITDQLL